MNTDRTRYIFVSGGVVSGLGKGIFAASLALLLKARGFAVAPIKCDMHINLDAGTLDPQKGEIFVTADGLQADPGLGHYERFLNVNMARENYMTTGQIYDAVIERERTLDYEGKCVEVVPHMPEEIIRRIEAAGAGAEFVIVELGGTVGEYQGEVFLEASRILTKRSPGRAIHLHVAYFPYLESLGELKSKPAQLSIRKLNECGILPDFVIARSARAVDAPRFSSLCQNSNLEADQVILVPDFGSVYEVPLHLEDVGFVPRLLRRLGISLVPHPQLFNWARQVYRLVISDATAVRIGIVHGSGDAPPAYAYVSLLEALCHAEGSASGRVEVEWLSADSLSPHDATERLRELDGLIVPPLWGETETGGVLAAIRFARETGLPFLGIGTGMDLALEELLRNAPGAMGKGSGTPSDREVDETEAVVQPLEGLEAVGMQPAFGGPVQVGNFQVQLVPGTLLQRLYGEATVTERQRCRTTVNWKHREAWQAAGVVFSGLSFAGTRLEALELTRHRFFVAVQFRPEFRSRFEAPHPLLTGLLRACRQPRSDMLPAPSADPVASAASTSLGDPQ
ncbi:MAG: CTP synthase [Armatimonadota bacterium]